MRTKVDFFVCICLLLALYVNLTSKPERNREVRGTLIKLEKQNDL